MRSERGHGLSRALLAQRRQRLGHLVPLLLAALVRAQALLRDLQGALESRRRADPQQLDHAALVGREPRHLADYLLDQAVTLGLPAYAVGRLRLHGPAGGDEALVEPRC